MTIDVIAKIAGVLGFLIGVSTFILTRLERRKKIEIELFHASIIDFNDDESVKDEELIKVRFTNIGQQPVILKPDTLSIEYNKTVYHLDREDYLGKDNFQELMPPMSSREIGIHLDSVMRALNIKSPKKYDDVTFNKLYPLKIWVLDHFGKKYRNIKYSYHESVGEFAIKK